MSTLQAGRFVWEPSRLSILVTGVGATMIEIVVPRRDGRSGTMSLWQCSRFPRQDGC